MLFTVVDHLAAPPSKERAFLIRNGWDDHFSFETLFQLVVFESNGNPHVVGYVKIGQFGQTQRKPNLPPQFDALDDRFFSLGQDDDYYETLNKFAPAFRDRILSGLRDVAADNLIYERAKNERVMAVSLMRHVSAESITGRFRRLSRGDAKLTPFRFIYEFPKPTEPEAAPLALGFDVIPESMPPTNVHVLIGRNGVGKTRCLNRMTRALVEPKEDAAHVGSFTSLDSPSDDGGSFASVVSVSFSAFDPFEPLVATADNPHAIPYWYVGLRPEPPQTSGSPPHHLFPLLPVTRATPPGGVGLLTMPPWTARRAPKTPEELAGDFERSVGACRVGARALRWRRALEALESDPLFRETEVTQLADESTGQDWATRARRLYEDLSSGHKIVLLTVTRLVETVVERTLVLIDEPEAHLHPPLLAAFVRSLSDLLMQRNGVAIIATHSPVVLQEVPKTCVWILRRSGNEVLAERPENETFGENVGVLTREAFSLEVTQSGFHKLLLDAVAQSPSYEAVLARFGDQLGAEARAIARGLFAARSATRTEDDV